MPTTLLDWGVRVIMELQTLPGPFLDFFRLATLLGDEEFYLIFLPLLYWTVDNRLRLRVGIFFAISVVLNTLLKAGFHSPRPYWTTSHVALLTRPSTGFGSLLATHSTPSCSGAQSPLFWAAAGGCRRGCSCWPLAFRAWCWAFISQPTCWLGGEWGPCCWRCCCAGKSRLRAGFASCAPARSSSSSGSAGSR